MKETYTVPSDRYHRLHRFVRKENGNYDFVPEQDWMPIYVTMKEDNSGVYFVDTEGGPCIGEGFSTNEVIVEKINQDEKGNIEFVLKEIE